MTDAQRDELSRCARDAQQLLNRRDYSLCRCGHSQNKPFCSGIHWSVHFTDPVLDAGHQWTLFEWAGGLPALTRMTRLFYSKYVAEDQLIGPLFANMSPDHPERVASWLGEVFGGPKNYSDRYGGYPRMLTQHVDVFRRWLQAGTPNQMRSQEMTIILAALRRWLLIDLLDSTAVKSCSSPNPRGDAPDDEGSSTRARQDSAGQTTVSACVRSSTRAWPGSPA